MLLVLLSSTGCTKKLRIKWNMHAANRDFAAEKYDAAEVEYKKVLQLERINAVAIGQLGRIFEKEGRTLEAGLYLRKAVELMPESLPYELAYGKVLVSVHSFTNAANIAWRVLNFQPTNSEGLLLLMDSRGPAADMELKLDAMPRVKDNPAYHLAMAILGVRQQQFDRAENEVQKALAANPKSSEAYFVMADLRARQKDEKGAVEALRKASDLAPWRSAMRIRYIDFLIRNNNDEEARKNLAQITEHAPDFVPAWIGLMNLSMSEKKYVEAAKYADTVVERDERNYDGLLGRGTARLAQGDGDGAVIQFEHVNALYPRTPQVLYQLASAYLITHNRVKCVETLNFALSIAPDYVQAILLLAQLDIENGDASAAQKLLSAYIKRTTSAVAQVYLLLADADVMLNKPDDALGIYSYLAKVLPASSKVPFLSGIVLLQQKKAAAAKAAFEHALELEPDFLAAAKQLINLDIAEHDFAAAEKVAQVQINRSPKLVEPLEFLAEVEYAQTNLPGTEAALNKAIALDPKSARPYIMLAQVFVKRGDYPTALKKLDAAAAQTNDLAIFLQMGELNDEVKNYTASRDAYEKALSVNSNSITALNNLSYIYAERLQQLDKGYELAERARQLTPFNPNIADTVGWILYRQGQYKKALTILQGCAEKAPNDAEIQYHLGMDNYMLAQEDAARAALQRAMALSTNFQGRDDARNRLAILDINASNASPQALAVLEQALKDRPDDPAVLNRLGYQEEKAGQWDKAAATYEATLKQHPDAEPIMAKLAWLYTFQLHNADRAMELAREAHTRNNADPVASEILGHWLFRTHDYQRAVSILEETADRLPNQPAVLQDLAWAYYSVGRVADSMTVMQKAIQYGATSADMGDPKRFVTMAAAFADSAKAGALADDAKQALQADAAYVPALMIAAANQQHAGDFKGAQQSYGKALDVYPTFTPAQRELTLLDARHFQDDPNGFAFGEKARTAYPDDSEVVKSLGILSFFQGKYPRSVELLRPIVAEGSSDGEIHYYLGMDYFQLKHNKESRQTLEKALTLNLPEKLAAEAKKTLASLP